MTDTSITLVEELVEETRGLLTRGKELLVKVAYNLHTLRESGEWKETHESFPKYCQEVFDLSQSTTSKYMAVAEYFSAKFLPEDIGPVAIENLYMAAKLPGTPEENLSRAKTWTRDDFKAEKREKDPNEPEWFAYRPETISRVEVINYADDSGRTYVYWPKKKLHISLSSQDDGKTLKIFIENAQETTPEEES